jgi:amphi-Trp domain-containing protein
MSKTELEFEQRVTAEQAAAYLEEVAEGLRTGALELSAGDERVRLSPGEVVKIELEASSDNDKQELSIEMKWHVSGVKAIVEQPRLEVTSSPSPAVVDESDLD